MKIRNGFITNSSSSSFTISKEYLTEDQIWLIWRHASIAKYFGLGTPDDCDVWEIEEKVSTIEGSTDMDNFDMYTYLEKIGINMNNVGWNY